MEIIEKGGEKFETEIIFTTGEYEHIIMKECVFQRDVIFERVHIHSEVYFENCTFYGNVLFTDCRFDKRNPDSFLQTEDDFSVEFSGCHLYRDLTFHAPQKDKTIKSVFEKGILIHNSSSVSRLVLRYIAALGNGILIKESKIETTLLIDDIRSVPGVEFSESSIMGQVRISRLNANQCYFNKSHFHKDVQIWNAALGIGFNFNHSSFGDILRLTASNCESVYINGGEFSGLCVINIIDDNHREVGGEIRDIIRVEKAKFLGKFMLNGDPAASDYSSINRIEIIASKELQGDYSFDKISVKNLFKLEGYNWDALFRFRNIQVNCLEITTFHNLGVVVFQNITPYRNPLGNLETVFKIHNSDLGKTSFLSCDMASFRKTIIEDSILSDVTTSNVKWFDPRYLNQDNRPPNRSDKQLLVDYWSAQREVFRQLKNSSEGNKDRPQALIFKAYEFDAFTKSQKLSTKNWSEKFVLWLNWISNKNGLKWFRALLFIIGSWILFFSFFIMSTYGFAFFWDDNWEFLLNKKWFWEEAIQYLWLPDGLEGLKVLYDNASGFQMILGVISFFLGKISIAFGIVQLVSAFRKYFKA